MDGPGRKTTTRTPPRGPGTAACRSLRTPASHSGKDATRSVRRDALMTVFRVYSRGRKSLSPRVSPRKNLNRKK